MVSGEYIFLETRNPLFVVESSISCIRNLVFDNSYAKFCGFDYFTILTSLIIQSKAYDILLALKQPGFYGQTETASIKAGLTSPNLTWMNQQVAGSR